MQTSECPRPWLWSSRPQLGLPGKGPGASAGRGWPELGWSLPGGPDRLRGAKRCPGGPAVRPASVLWAERGTRSDGLLCEALEATVETRVRAALSTALRFCSPRPSPRGKRARQEHAQRRRPVGPTREPARVAPAEGPVRGRWGGAALGGEGAPRGGEGPPSEGRGPPQEGRGAPAEGRKLASSCSPRPPASPSLRLFLRSGQCCWAGAGDTDGRPGDPLRGDLAD